MRNYLCTLKATFGKETVNGKQYVKYRNVTSNIITYGTQTN